MPWDVANRWNSTYDMLRFAFAYIELINQITGDRSMKIRQYEILTIRSGSSSSNYETVLKQFFFLFIILTLILLSSFLQIFKTVTLKFSGNTPCIAKVIPAMDKMHNELTTASNNEEYLPAIRAALGLGIKLLNKYYSLTDNSEVYRIAMGLYFIKLSCQRRLINY